MEGRPIQITRDCGNSDRRFQTSTHRCRSLHGLSLITGWAGAQSRWRSVWLHRGTTQLSEGMACRRIHRPHRWLHRPWRTPLRTTGRNPYVRSDHHPNQYIEQLLHFVAQGCRGMPLSKDELVGRRGLCDVCCTPGMRSTDRGLCVFWRWRKSYPIGLKGVRRVEPHGCGHGRPIGSRGNSPD